MTSAVRPLQLLPMSWRFRSHRRRCAAKRNHRFPISLLILTWTVQTAVVPPTMWATIPCLKTKVC